MADFSLSETDTECFAKIEPVKVTKAINKIVFFIFLFL
jgi:hypothetical protein